MSKLTDNQLVALSTAAQRDDGAVVLPDRLKGGAAAKAMKPLISKGLVKEIRAKLGMPVWRRDEEEARSFALTITLRGRKAINVEDEAGSLPSDTAEVGRPTKTGSRGRNRRFRTPGSKGRSVPTVPAADVAAPRAGSKLALVIGMLCDTGGATIDAIVSATGWLPHTTRAAFTGLRKRGYLIERVCSEKGETLYRIVTRNRNAA
jgi:Protein of unknown function (DUF3489)